MASLLDPESGERTQVEPANGVDFTLEEMQGFVGGWIEIVRLSPFHGDKLMVVDEEGLNKDLSINLVASSMADRPIVGPALVVDSSQVR
jgi:hypothetical protein